MSFRRLPFQCTATDPAERQQELRKRFGLPFSEDMYVDFPNSSNMGAGTRELNSASSSPRLQHRVPIFVEGLEPGKSSVDSSSIEGCKKPRVRVIPIEVEGVRSPTAANRHRTYSGPAGFANEENQYDPLQHRQSISPVKHSMQDLSMLSRIKSPTGPRVCNIPIQIEGKGSKDTSVNKVPKCTTFNKAASGNGCYVSKVNVQSEAPKDQKSEPDISIPVKKIDAIVSTLKSYEEAVANFTGTVKDKQYRFLDEMLTRCMLKLDDIDTMGNETVRMVRKAAIRKVQDSIDLLESKVNAAKESLAEESKVESIDIIEGGDQNEDKTVDALEVPAANMKEVETELELDNMETASSGKRKDLNSQVETNNVNIAEDVTIVDQDMESSQAENVEMSLKESKNLSGVNTESVIVTDAKEIHSGQIEAVSQEREEDKTVSKVLDISSDAESYIGKMTDDKEVADKIKQFPSNSSERKTNGVEQKEISDLDMPDVTEVQEQKQDLSAPSFSQDKINNMTVQQSSNETSCVSGGTSFMNSIHPELQNKISSEIQPIDTEVCDSIKHPVLDSQCDSYQLNGCDTK